MTRRTRSRQLSLENLERRDVPTFVTPPVYPAGTNPTGMEAVDFNGDGLQDLAVANDTGPGFVTVLLNTGEGAFGAPRSFPTGGTGSVALKSADFNGDGRLDLVAVNSDSGTVSVLRGTGTGLFRRPVTYSAGSLPWDTAVADLNGDGRLDLAVANKTSPGAVSILLNNGDATFGTAVAYVTGNGTRSIAAADFNSDGKSDLLVANSESSNIGILFGSGDGSFGGMKSFSTGDGPYAVAAADVNGDGNPDALVAHLAGVLGFLRGNGNGDFNGDASLYTIGAVPIALRIADVTADGTLDVVTATQSWEGVTVLVGTSDGAFVGYSEDLLSDSVYGGLAVADFNGDGHLDFAATQTVPGKVAVLIASNSGYQTTTLYPVGGGFRQLDKGDLNNDGNLDLVTANSNKVSVLLGAGFGGFQAVESYAVNGQARGVAIEDYNADGNLDLAVSTDSQHRVVIFLGNGDGSFQAPKYNTATCNTPETLTIVDFNEDGIADLLAPCFEGGFTVLQGNGDGTFKPGNPGLGGQFNFLAAGDLNNDGHVDVVTDGDPTDGNVVRVNIAKGDGTFFSPILVPTNVVDSAIALGDFDNDGNLDVIDAGREQGTNQGSVGILYGNGDGTFQPSVIFHTGGYHFAAAVAVADFDGDGKLDLGVANSNDQYDPRDTVAVLLNRGDGSFKPPLVSVGGRSPGGIVAGDFNSDGTLDLAVGGKEFNGPNNFCYVTVHISADDWSPIPIGGIPNSAICLTNNRPFPMSASRGVVEKRTPENYSHRAAAIEWPVVAKAATLKPNLRPAARGPRAQLTDVLSLDLADRHGIVSSRSYSVEETHEDSHANEIAVSSTSP